MPAIKHFQKDEAIYGDIVKKEGKAWVHEDLTQGIRIEAKGGNIEVEITRKKPTYNQFDKIHLTFNPEEGKLLSLKASNAVFMSEDFGMNVAEETRQAAEFLAKVRAGMDVINYKDWTMKKTTGKKALEYAKGENWHLGKSLEYTAQEDARMMIYGGHSKYVYLETGIVDEWSVVVSHEYHDEKAGNTVKNTMIFKDWEGQLSFEIYRRHERGDDFIQRLVKGDDYHYVDDEIHREGEEEKMRDFLSQLRGMKTTKERDLTHGVVDGRVANPVLFVHHNYDIQEFIDEYIRRKPLASGRDTLMEFESSPSHVVKTIAYDYAATGNSLQIAIGQLQNEQQRGNLSDGRVKYFQEVIAELQTINKKGFVVATAHRVLDASVALSWRPADEVEVANELVDFCKETNKPIQTAIDELTKELNEKDGVLPKETKHFAAIIDRLTKIQEEKRK